MRSSTIIHVFTHSSTLWAVLSAAGSSCRLLARHSLHLLTKLVCGEMLRPERLAVGQFHLILQLQAVALEWRTAEGRPQEGGGVTLALEKVDSLSGC